MEVPICRHIKTNGLQCRAASLNEGPYCYFHRRLHRQHSNYRTTDATRGYLIPGQHLELTALEDRDSIQLALSLVINALATGYLEPRRATAILYGLQLASNNAIPIKTQPAPSDVVRSVDSSPEGLDLAAPGARIQIDAPESGQAENTMEYLRKLCQADPKLHALDAALTDASNRTQRAPTQPPACPNPDPALL